MKKKSPSIAIDIRMINNAGIGTYISNLMPLIVELLSESCLYLLGDQREILTYPWGLKENVTVINFTEKIYSIEEQIQFMRKIPGDVNVFWSPHYNIPLLFRGKLVVTIHDVFHLAMPQFSKGLAKRIYANLMFMFIRRRANHIICDSHFTAHELVLLAGCKSEKITVVHCGIDTTWFRDVKPDRPHSRPYILFVGTVKPHKNLSRLIKACETIFQRIEQDLIIVGQKDGFRTIDKNTQVVAADLEGRIIFTGYINDALLRQYYSHADLLVLPSLYEGFGFPPLEAMACGCPTLVSQCASLPEICGDASLYCDPYSIDDIANKILLALENNQLRKNLRLKGYNRVKEFSWEKCASEITKVIIEGLK